MIIYGKWEVLVSNLMNVLDLLDIDIIWEDQRISTDCIGVTFIMKRNTTFDIFIIMLLYFINFKFHENNLYGTALINNSALIIAFKLTDKQTGLQYVLFD